MRNLRTKIEEAMHTFAIGDCCKECETQAVDQICTIFKEETIKQVEWALNEFEKRFINSLEDTNEKK